MTTLHQHFRTAAKHHAQLAECHGDIAKAHSDRADGLSRSSERDFHKSLSDHHRKLQQLHEDHSDHLHQLSKGLKQNAESGGIDSVTPEAMGHHGMGAAEGEHQLSTPDMGQLERAALAADTYFEGLLKGLE